MEIDFKFKRNESFYIREGWFQKAIHTIKEKDPKHNVFSKTYGVVDLGIGSNMVKGLKYWLTSANIITSTVTKTELSEFGELIYRYDPYFETSFVWFLIHYFLSASIQNCPVFNVFFNSNIMKFEKSNISQYITNELKKYSNNEIKKEYVEDDLGVFLKSYTSDDKDGNPEDNYICPLSSLKLIEKNKDYYIKKRPKYSSLSFLIVYYSLTLLHKKEAFTIEDCLEEFNSPVAIFNLDKNTFLQYLEEMKRHDLITINKTAGLNTIYLQKKLTLKEIFKLGLGGK